MPRLPWATSPSLTCSAYQVADGLVLIADQGSLEKNEALVEAVEQLLSELSSSAPVAAPRLVEVVTRLA